MKNLLVITLIFLVGCSQNFKYVLDCEMQEDGMIKKNLSFQGPVTISFNDIKVGSSLFYNLTEYKVSDVYQTNSSFTAESFWNSNLNKHVLRLNRRTLNLGSYFYGKDNKDAEWIRLAIYGGHCKLR